MQSEPGAIHAEHLCKRFGATVAVQDVSFDVARGEVVGFLGPNGAGKSTTLRMLTGVFPPSSGRASVAGHDVVRDPLAARRALGYLPERNALYGDMDVSSFLGFVAEMKRIAPREVSAAVRRAMGAAGIEHVAHRLLGNLSKGYRQRVGIAQALLGDPPVLILDEPTSGLDPEQVAEIRGLIRGLGAERTVVLSTHVLPEVESVCSRVIVMSRGRIVAVDQPSRLERRLRPHHEILVRVVGSQAAVLAALAAVAGVVEAAPVAAASGALGGGGAIEACGTALAPAEPGFAAIVRCAHGRDVRAEVATALAAGGFGLLELRPVVMTLEEIFLALITDGAAERGGGVARD